MCLFFVRFCELERSEGCANVFHDGVGFWADKESKRQRVKEMERERVKETKRRGRFVLV